MSRAPVPQILILGAGYAGLMACARLLRSPVPMKLVVVSARPVFEQRIRLHEVLCSGKVKAALRPIYGADKIIRFLLALLRKQPEGLCMAFRSLNGRLALVVSDQAGPVQVFSIRAGERGIEQVYMVLNPDKLRLETEFRA